MHKISRIKVTFLFLFIIITSNLIAFKASAELLLADRRFTEAAKASDYSQCAAILTIFTTTLIATKIKLKAVAKAYKAAAAAAPTPITKGILTAKSHFTTFTAPWVALAAATAAYMGTVELLELWAAGLRENTIIVNTIDKGKLGYKRQYDHTIELNKLGCHFNEIGIQYIGDGQATNTTAATADQSLTCVADPGIKWISANDCQPVVMSSPEDVLGIDSTRQVCVYEKGDKICAEIVLCSGLIIGDMISFNGNIWDGTDHGPKRACGSLDVNDYLANGRCECKGCGIYTVPGLTLPDNYQCETRDERYQRHCITKAFPEDDIPIPAVTIPLSLSEYCRMDTTFGYSDFPVSGRVIRCFEDTLRNLILGLEVYLKDNVVPNQQNANQGAFTSKEVSESTLAKYGTRCIGATGANPQATNCEEGMLNRVQIYLKRFVTLLLILWISTVGIKVILGGGRSHTQLFVWIFKYAIVWWFALGTAWHDQYYDAVLNAGNNLAGEFMKAATNYRQEKAGDTCPKGSQMTFGCNNEVNILNCEAFKNQINSCNFIQPIEVAGSMEYLDPNGVAYSTKDRHYAIWDTLDCKIAHYTGFHENKTFPKIITTAFGYLWSNFFSYGIPFFVAAIVFLVSCFTILFRAIYIGVVAILMINILILISPLIIPLVLFDNSKEIFQKWLQQLLGYSLQPIVLFAAISMTMIIIDNFLLSSTDAGSGMYKIFGATYGFTPGTKGVKVPGVSGASDDEFFALIIFTFVIIIMKHFFNMLNDLMGSLLGVGAAVPTMAQAAGQLGKAGGWARRKMSNKVSGKYQKAVRGAVSPALEKSGKAMKQASAGFSKACSEYGSAKKKEAGKAISSRLKKRGIEKKDKKT
jgi:type IV secretory pathway VirB6-like protein